MPNGTSAWKKSPGVKPYAVKMNRFCGLPTGVTMPPRFAAMACRTMTRTKLSRQPAASSASTAMGTNVSKATSLVMSIDEKNGSMTRAVHTTRFDRSPATSAWAMRVMTPLELSPATDAIRQNKSTMTFQSI